MDNPKTKQVVENFNVDSPLQKEIPPSKSNINSPWLPKSMDVFEIEEHKRVLHFKLCFLNHHNLCDNFKRNQIPYIFNTLE